MAQNVPPYGGHGHPYDQGPPSPVNVGDIVDKYRVERIVGIGAMGVVVAARHTTLDQIVAIKFLVEHKFGSAEESIARFLGEARAAARIDSDHVCKVTDVDMLPNGVPYMIMEHLDGSDLEEEIDRRGQLDIVESVDYVLQALDAISAAHSLGIVHRDLKPANLFLARRPDGSRRVKVLDFGISKATTMGKQRYTRETKSLGTPAYMPPEQIKDPMGVDQRADIWALGAILYEILTGQMAFVGNNIKEVLDRVLGEDPCPIQALRHDVPPDLINVVARALNRDRDLRFQTAATFARSLAFFGSIGVLNNLTNIQREVGSLSSISAARLAPIMTDTGPIAPMHLPHNQPPASQRHRAAAGPYVHTPPHGYPAQQQPYNNAYGAPSVEPMVSNLPHQTSVQPDPGELSRRHFVQQDWTALQARKRQARAAILGMTAAFLFASTVAVLAYRFNRSHARAAAAAAAAAAASQAPPEATNVIPSATVSAVATTPPPAPTPTPVPTPSVKNVHPAPTSPKTGPNPRSR